MCAVLSPSPYLNQSTTEEATAASLSSPSLFQMDRGGGGRGMPREEHEAAGSTNQKTESFEGCSSSSSVEKIYPIDSPIKKRKSQYDINDSRLSSLKYKFQDLLTCQKDETARTESLGGDDIFINKNCDMANLVKEMNSCENTQSLLGGCIEVDSINGIESRSMRKRASESSSSSNNISSDAYSSFPSRGSGTKETDSWVRAVRPHLEHDHSGLMLQPYDDDIERMYNVMNELASGGVDGSADHIIDEKLYSNGVDDFMILPAGKTGCHGEKKKLTIDQEFQQYFSKLML